MASVNPVGVEHGWVVCVVDTSNEYHPGHLTVRLARHTDRKVQRTNDVDLQGTHRLEAVCNVSGDAQRANDRATLLAEATCAVSGAGHY